MPRSFKLVETLGEGSFGAVHLAEVEAGEGFVQRLAVKWLLPQWSHDAELAGRLRDEARLLGLLNHDHIVRVHGLTRIGGRLAILMEAVDGVDLSRLTGKMPPRAALQVIEGVADALDAAWQTVPPGGDAPLRVVHRDIKPSNIMVSGRGGVKVMDFGVARATFDAREARTKSQQYGTARYMAPERWLEGLSDAPSDVFSLGITLIELVGGEPVERPRLAREGFTEDLARAMTPLAAWPEIRELAEKMTAYNWADRPSAADVAVVCRTLMPGGADLKSWAPEFMARHQGLRRQQGIEGSIVHEDVSAETFDAAQSPLTGTAPLPGAVPASEAATLALQTPAVPRLQTWAPSGDMASPSTSSGNNRGSSGNNRGSSGNLRGPSGSLRSPGDDTLDDDSLIPTGDIFAPVPERVARRRWSQAMRVAIVVAITVLLISSWQAMRAAAKKVELPPVASTFVEPSTQADRLPEPAPVTPATPNPTETVAAVAEPKPETKVEGEGSKFVGSETKPTVDEPPVQVVVVPPAETPPAEPPVGIAFWFDPKLTVMLTPGGVATPRRVFEFAPGTTFRVDVSGSGEPFSCTVRAEPSRGRVDIVPEARTCR